jgi:uncharacterized membrane protein YbhN (UPF0104 family)
MKGYSHLFSFVSMLFKIDPFKITKFSSKPQHIMATKCFLMCVNNANVQIQKKKLYLNNYHLYFYCIQVTYISLFIVFCSCVFCLLSLPMLISTLPFRQLNYGLSKWELNFFSCISYIITFNTGCSSSNPRKEYRRYFPPGKAVDAWGWHLVTKLRMRAIVISCLYGVVFK